MLEKSWQLRRNIIANVQCLLLTLRHALKQSCHWSIAWSMKLCWLLITYQSHAASAHWRPSLVSDKQLGVGFSWCLVSRRWCTGVVFMQPGVKVNGAHHYAVLLLKQLLPDIYQLLATFAFQRITRAQEKWAAATQDSRLHTGRSLPTDQTSVL